MQTTNCLTNLTDLSMCSKSLFGYNIVASLANATDTIYLSNNLFANRTQSITNNTKGPTSPSLEATLTWTFRGIPQTVTAISVRATVAAATLAAGSSAATGTTVSATALASTSAKARIGRRLVVNTRLVKGTIAVVAAAVVL
jgi:hypothetical protein